MTKKKLYRSRENRMIAGVCGGLGEYFEIDPTLVRLALVFLALWWGGGILLYLLAWFIIPEEPAREETEKPSDGQKMLTTNEPTISDEAPDSVRGA